MCIMHIIYTYIFNNNNNDNDNDNFNETSRELHKTGMLK